MKKQVSQAEIGRPPPQIIAKIPLKKTWQMALLFGDEKDWDSTLKREVLHHNTSLFAMCYSLDHQYLIAASDTGVINVYHLVSCLRQQKGRPTFCFPATTSPIYSLAFAGTAKKPILMVGSDEETLGYDWNEIITASTDWTDNGLPSTAIHAVVRLEIPQKSGRRGQTTGIAETNALRCDTLNNANIVYAAAGDSVCYQWNIETSQCVGKLVGHQKYLHDVVLLPQSNAIATASEDGTVKMWDSRNASCTSTATPLGEEGAVVRSLLIDAGENWLVCGGSSGTKGRLALLCGGVMAGVAASPAPIHSLCECDGLIVSVGAEGFLRNWSRDLTRVITTVSTTPSISYDVIYNGKNESARILASCGACGDIDLFIPSDDVCTPCGFVLEVAGQYEGVIR